MNPGRKRSSLISRNTSQLFSFFFVARPMAKNLDNFASEKLAQM
jgi:hypothetical protein